MVMEREWIGDLALPLEESVVRGFGIARALMWLWSQAWLAELVLELERVQVLEWGLAWGWVREPEVWCRQ